MASVSGSGRTSSVRWTRRAADRLDVRRASSPRSFPEIIELLPVPVEPPFERREPSRRPAAAFVAQLLAARLDLPQSREIRRAGPDEADALYLAGDPAMRPTLRGSLIRRDV